MVDVSVLTNLGAFKGGLASLSAYLWVLYIVVPLVILIFVGVGWKMWGAKKKQWTHTLRVRRVLNNGFLSKENTIKMRRFPLIKNASVFHLEKAFLGSYLLMELDSYTGTNEFSVIIDKNNRIYINQGEKFDAASSSVLVSAKHAGIDLAFEDLKSDWQKINSVDKKTDWKDIAKFMALGLLIVAVMVVSIKGIGQWGENHKLQAQKAVAEAEAFGNLADAMETTQATLNVQVLILDLLREEYGTNNIQRIIREKTNETV